MSLHEAIEEAILAEQVFLSRWRLSSLKRVDPKLYDRLEEQRILFDKAIFSDDRESKLQGEAMQRGWAAATQRMIVLDEPDDAFMYGTDPKTGAVVAIGVAPPKDSRLHLKNGHRVTFVTPDEVATMVAAYGALIAVKQAFPDCEVLAIA